MSNSTPLHRRRSLDGFKNTTTKQKSTPRVIVKQTAALLLRIQNSHRISQKKGTANKTQVDSQEVPHDPKINYWNPENKGFDYKGLPLRFELLCLSSVTILVCFFISRLFSSIILLGVTCTILGYYGLQYSTRFYNLYKESEKVRQRQEEELQNVQMQNSLEIEQVRNSRSAEVNSN